MPTTPLKVSSDVNGSGVPAVVVAVKVAGWSIFRAPLMVNVPPVGAKATPGLPMEAPESGPMAPFNA